MKPGEWGEKEYGYTRGIDFVDISCVLNFDLLPQSGPYSTGRAYRDVNVVCRSNSFWRKNKVVGCLPSAEKDELVFSKIEKEKGARESKRVKEYNFDMKQVEPPRYRMEGALRGQRFGTREAS